MCTGAAHNTRRGRESFRKRFPTVALIVERRDDRRCVYCGATALSSGCPLHFDHLDPKSRGGTDDPTNVVLSCRSCNSRRQHRSLWAWSRRARGLSFTALAIRAHAARVPS
jgi:5-methylcytosine-specific restriction endonuclease McrA